MGGVEPPSHLYNQVGAHCPIMLQGDQHTSEGIKPLTQAMPAGLEVCLAPQLIGVDLP